MYTNEDFKKVKDCVEKFDRFAIFIHENPDIDAVVSATVMYKYLLSLGKKVDIYAPSTVSANCEFLSFSEKVEALIDGTSVPKERNYDVYLILDTAELPRLVRTGSLEIPDSVVTIRMDHHENKIDFEDIRVHGMVSSATEIVLDYLKYVEFEIDSDIAMSLMAGILSDTGWFAFNTTKPEALEKLASLLRFFPQMPLLYSHVFCNYREEFAPVWQVMLSKLKFDKDKGLNYVIMDNETYNGLNIDKRNYDDARIFFVDNTMRKFKGYDLCLLVTETEPGFYQGSLRSDVSVYNCSEICKLFEVGGGYIPAGGFKTHRSVDEIMKTIYSGMEKFKL